MEELLASSRLAGCPVSSYLPVAGCWISCARVCGGERAEERDGLFSWKAKANVRTLSRQRPLTIAVGKRAATPRTASLICVGNFTASEDCQEVEAEGSFALGSRAPCSAFLFLINHRGEGSERRLRHAPRRS